MNQNSNKAPLDSVVVDVFKAIDKVTEVYEQILKLEKEEHHAE